MQIEIGRLLVMNAAWKLDQGDRARKEVSMAKVHVADTLHQAADVAIQLNGARGYSKDTILEWIYRYARQARLVDGASEVHNMVLAALHARGGQRFLELERRKPGVSTITRPVGSPEIGRYEPDATAIFGRAMSALVATTLDLAQKIMANPNIVAAIAKLVFLRM